jgi:hypothetical protein
MPGFPGPQVCTGAASLLSLLCVALNFAASASFYSIPWYTVTNNKGDTFYLNLAFSGRGFEKSRFPTANLGCLGDFQAFSELWTAVDGSSAANTLLVLSLVCSVAMMLSSCNATNNHCLVSRDGAAAQLLYVSLSSKWLTIALGSLAFAFNLAGAITAWVTVGGFAKWFSRQIMRGTYSYQADVGSSLVGVALAGNLLALYLAVLPFYAPPPHAQQLVEDREQEQELGGAATGAGRASAVSLP